MLARRWSLITIAVALASTGPATAQPASLDAVAQRLIAQERVAGASVLVVPHGKVLLDKGYGFADLGLAAPTKDETVYHVEPMLPFTGVAVMQPVEHGKLALDGAP
jgi:CubicO group peptidase (beta-lactamase class C family)